MKKPKARAPKPTPEDTLAAATGEATAAAEEVAEERRAKDAARKREARAKEREEGRANPTRRKAYPKPEDFNDHPLAIALNTFADKAARLPGSGAAQASGLGQSWMAVLDFYFGDVVNHPVTAAALATGQFAALVWALHSQANAQAQAKGPGSPAGENPVEPVLAVLDVKCHVCQQPFPDVPLMLAHVAQDHAGTGGLAA